MPYRTLLLLTWSLCGPLQALCCQDTAAAIPTHPTSQEAFAVERKELHKLRAKCTQFLEALKILTHFLEHKAQALAAERQSVATRYAQYRQEIEAIDKRLAALEATYKRLFPAQEPSTATAPPTPAATTTKSGPATPSQPPST